LEDIFQRFCISLANRNGRVFNLVFGRRCEFEDRLIAYRDVLCQYSPAQICREYGGRPRQLLLSLLDVRGFTDEQKSSQLRPCRGRDQPLFQKYADGVLQGAAYFCRFTTKGCFQNFVEDWLKDPDRCIVLPSYFESLGIPGFRYALAADFLKEIGVKELGKPDQWVRNIMVAAHWIRGLNVPDVVVQRAFRDASESLSPEYPPVVIDKLMYLVGAGNFGMVEPAYRCRSRFEIFQEYFAQHA
jgi:hypothetical protein